MVTCKHFHHWFYVAENPTHTTSFWHKVIRVSVQHDIFEKNGNYFCFEIFHYFTFRIHITTTIVQMSCSAVFYFRKLICWFDKFERICRTKCCEIRLCIYCVGICQIVCCAKCLHSSIKLWFAVSAYKTNGDKFGVKNGTGDYYKMRPTHNDTHTHTHMHNKVR